MRALLGRLRVTKRTLPCDPVATPAGPEQRRAEAWHYGGMESVQPGKEIAIGQRCVLCEGALDSESRCTYCGAASRAGTWRIRKLLSQRPAGRVYLAEDEAGRRVALKELLFSHVPDTRTLEVFERESSLLRQLSHPQIPALVDFFRVGRGAGVRLYLAEQFVEGLSLLQKLQSHRFNEEEAKAVARQVLTVLDYLHGLSPRVIHRDLKPSNLIERSDGTLALVDFGSARDVNPFGTHNATLVGSFGYMPLEQLGGTVDATCDLYALGATLCHLLAAREPAEMLGSGMRLQFELYVNVSEPFTRFLAALLSPEPSQRFQSVDAARKALEERPLAERLLAERPAEAAPAEPQTRGPMDRTTFALATASAFFVLVGGVVVMLRSGPMVREPPHPPPPVAATSTLGSEPVREGILRYVQARVAFDRSDYRKVLVLCDELENRFQGQPEARWGQLLAARAARALGETDLARAQLEPLLKDSESESPDFLEALRLSAEIHLDAGSAEQARQEFDEYLRRETRPGGVTARLARARALAALGEREPNARELARADLREVVARATRGSDVERQALELLQSL